MYVLGTDVNVTVECLALNIYNDHCGIASSNFCITGWLQFS